MIYSIIGSFIGAALSNALALVVVLLIFTRKNNITGSAIAHEELSEEKQFFTEECKKIVEYAFNKNLNITIQPNYEGIYWLFNNDKGKMYAICEMVPGEYNQLVKKIDHYINHKDELVKEGLDA